MATRRSGDRGDSENQNHEYGPESQRCSAGTRIVAESHAARKLHCASEVASMRRRQV